MLANALCVIWCGRVFFFFQWDWLWTSSGLPVVSGCVVVIGLSEEQGGAGVGGVRLLPSVVASGPLST